MVAVTQSMADPLFQEAYARARIRFTEAAWLALTPRQITEAIYEEIRKIDAERAAELRAAEGTPDTARAPRERRGRSG